MRPVLAAILAVLALPAWAEGDISSGEKNFKKCKACHMIVSHSGEVIFKGGKTGPNLYGVAGRMAGSLEDYRYSDSLVAAGLAGVTWTEENFAAFTADPKAFLKEATDDPKAKSKMSFRLRKGQSDIYAYLASVAPAPVTTPAEDGADAESAATDAPSN